MTSTFHKKSSGTFCEEEPETIEHLLWNSNVIQNLLRDIDTW